MLQCLCSSKAEKLNIGVVLLTLLQLAVTAGEAHLGVE